MTHTPGARGANLADDWVEVRDAVVDNWVSLYHNVQAALGANAPGLPVGSEWDQCEQYLLTLRDNPEAWRSLIDTWSRSSSVAIAVRIAVREANRLERLLAGFGGWDYQPETMAGAVQYGADAVLRRAAQRAQKDAGQALEALARYHARPPTLVNPPLHIVQPEDMAMPRPTTTEAIDATQYPG